MMIIKKDIKFRRSFKDIPRGIYIPEDTIVKDAVAILRNSTTRAEVFLSFDWKGHWVTVPGDLVKFV